MVIRLVTGAPCSGKTTYVREHARPGDVVLDRDDLGEREFTRRLSTLDPARDTWVIWCGGGGPARRAQLAAQVGAHEVVHLDVPTHELMARARARSQPHTHVAAVRAWQGQEARGAGVAGAGVDPVPSPRTRW